MGLKAHIPLLLYPFLNTVSKDRPFEYLRLTSLGVIGALVKVDDAEVINFLLQTEIIPKSPSISMDLKTLVTKDLKAGGKSTYAFPTQLFWMAFANSSPLTSLSLLKSANSAISFHRLAMTSWFFLNVASSQLPLPSMTVLRTARHSKSFLSKKPLLSMSYMYLTTNLTRLSHE